MRDRDARFEESGPPALALKALTAEDLPVISALAQDAVFTLADTHWMARARRFAILLNRFRWEDAEAAEQAGRPYERVHALLVVQDVMHVASSGVDRRDRDVVLSLLSIVFEPGAPPAGRLLLTLAGDGEIALDVECLDVALRDVTRPYAAPSGKAPRHPV